METSFTFTIREAQDLDRQAVKVLLDQHQLPSQDLPTSLENFLVAMEEEQIIGTVGLELYGPFALVRSLAVKPDLQRKGLGKTLYRATEHLARQKGVAQLYLLTTTAADFFQQQGFQHVERIAVPEPIRQSGQFAGICPSSATVLLKSLIL